MRAVCRELEPCPTKSSSCLHGAGVTAGCWLASQSLKWECWKVQGGMLSKFVGLDGLYGAMAA